MMDTLREMKAAPIDRGKLSSRRTPKIPFSASLDKQTDFMDNKTDVCNAFHQYRLSVYRTCHYRPGGEYPTYLFDDFFTPVNVKSCAKSAVVAIKGRDIARPSPAGERRQGRKREDVHENPSRQMNLFTAAGHLVIRNARGHLSK
jgi:hypothetical protein